MKEFSKNALNVCESGNWSGGGQGLLGNIGYAREKYPDKFSRGGKPVYLRNVVPISALINQRFVYLPQNAWAWHGPASSIGEVRRKKLLWAASEVAMNRAQRIVRIGPMVPDRRSNSDRILSNVLDAGFDIALAKSYSIASLDWLPTNEYMIVPGSLWTYRNIAAVISAFETYRARGGGRSLVIVGSISKGSGVRDSLKKWSDIDNVYLITEHVKRSELVFALRNAACCVLSSLVEASPVTLLEAAAVSTGIVAWDIPAYRYMVENESLEGVMFVKNELQLADSMSLVFSKNNALISSEEYRTTRRDRWVEDFIAACLG